LNLRSLFVLPLLLLCSCQQEMANRGRFSPMDYSSFFKDGRVARPQPLGTVARNQLHEDRLLYTGMQNSKLSTTFPFPVTREVVQRGQQRFDIYCAPCHDRGGTGKGLAVQNGFERAPVSFHEERLREAPPGYYYQAISNGFGVMNGYAAQIKPEDRWAIVAYIRALQLSENAKVADLPETDRRKVEAVK
jgi:mono/diheme cytochrome c family protein